MSVSGMVKWNSVPAVVIKPSGQQSNHRDRRVWGRERQALISKALGTVEKDMFSRKT